MLMRLLSKHSAEPSTGRQSAHFSSVQKSMVSQKVDPRPVKWVWGVTGPGRTRTLHTEKVESDLTMKP